MAGEKRKEKKREDPTTASYANITLAFNPALSCGLIHNEACCGCG